MFFKKRKTTVVPIVASAPPRVVDNFVELGYDELRGKCEPSIDMSVLKPFSIERTFMGTANERTEFGYFKSDGSTACWLLYCSRAQHEKLVREFIKHKI